MRKLLSIVLVFALLTPAHGDFRKRNSWGTTKPPSGTPIDWNNPITNGLTHAWMMNEQGGTTVNMAPTFDHNGTFDSSWVGILSWSPTPYGTGVKRTNSLTTHAGITFPAITTTTTFTLEILFLYGGGNSNDSYQNIFTFSSTTGFWIQGSGVHKVDFYYSGDHVANTTLVAGKVYHYVISVNGGNVTFYKNGASDGTSSGAPSFVAGGMLQDNGGAFVEPFTGTMVYERLWKGRALSQHEALQLFLGPYDMFQSPKTFMLVPPIANAVVPPPPNTFGVFPAGTSMLLIKPGGSNTFSILKP